MPRCSARSILWAEAGLTAVLPAHSAAVLARIGRADEETVLPIDHDDLRAAIRTGRALRPVAEPSQSRQRIVRQPAFGIENAVFEAGFDDSELTVRGGHAAIWVCHREGELTELVREALAQARAAGLRVLHVEMENTVFA